MKILITGGHLTPALATIDWISKHKPNEEIVFVGRIFTQENSNQKSHEFEETSSRNIAFLPITAIKLPDFKKISAPISFIKFFLSLIQSLIILLKQRPQVILSFGGYVAVPITIIGYILRIPIITHEQTRVLGSANKFISKLAKYVAISYSSTQKYISSNKVKKTGLPIREKTIIKNNAKPSWYQNRSDLPLLYITGGNQGSEIINSTIQQAIPQLVNHWSIIHQCGTPTASNNYLHDLSQARSKLKASQKQRYYIREWLTEEELSWIYSHIQAAISRAGANTVAELAHNNIPSILIPLPFSLANEQMENAKFFIKKGGGIILEQHELNPKSLIKNTEIMRKKYLKMKKSLEANFSAPDQKAAEKIYNLLKKAVKK